MMNITTDRTITRFSFLIIILFTGIACSDNDDTKLDGDLENAFYEQEEESVEDGDIEFATVSPTVFSEYSDEEKTVAYVDLDRYLGKWYEIATFVIPFQQGCTGSTATYAINEADSSVSVTNECFLDTLDGEYKVDTARAILVNETTNAELIVYFTEEIGADYWIIELDGQDSEDPYEWAVVGSSFPIFLWVLSRTPQMDSERLELILDRLEERGYNLENLSYTAQPEE